MSRFIDRLNSNIPKPVNKNSPAYQSIFGVTPFIPNVTILQPSDFNCGAVANALEFVNLFGQNYVSSMIPANASGADLQTVVMSFINLPRRGSAESDSVYQARFGSLVTQLTNPGRATKWAIRDALSYFIPKASISIVEFFDAHNLYFQVRVSGAVDYGHALVLDSLTQGFLDNFYVFGVGTGASITYLQDIVSRIKAAGVQFIILTVLTNSINLSSFAKIGTKQMMLLSGADIVRRGIQLNFTSYATITH